MDDLGHLKAELIENLNMEGRRVRVRGLPFCSRWSLRADQAELDRLALAWAAPLPTMMLSSASAGDRHALRLGPDEWLLLADAPNAADGIAKLESEIAMSLVEVSHRNVALEIIGENAATVLNAGVPLDLADEAFPAGCCTRTVFGKSEVVLWRPSAGTLWYLEFWRSFANYTRYYLSKAIADL
jgi:sarcosine oxidase subunit gamma